MDGIESGLSTSGIVVPPMNNPAPMGFNHPAMLDRTIKTTSDMLSGICLAIADIFRD